MGLLIDYYLAPDDDAAVAVIEGGPGGRLEALLDTGIEPSVNLAMYVELLTGRTFDEQLEAPECFPVLAEGDDGEVLVFGIDDGFVRALAEADPETVQRLAVPWAEIEEFDDRGDPEHLADFLSRLQVLARKAVAEGQHLYCWLSL